MPLACRVLLFPALLLLAACPKINSDWDRETDFRQYRTFAVRTGHQLQQNRMVPVTNDIVDNRILNAIRRELLGKGLREVTRDPDLYATYLARTENRQEIWSTVDPPYVYGWGYRRWGYWSPGFQRFMVTNYTEGTLAVDLVDARRRELVWRTYITDTIDPNMSGEKMERNLAKVMDKAFDKFPPPPPVR